MYAFGSGNWRRSFTFGYFRENVYFSPVQKSLELHFERLSAATSWCVRYSLFHLLTIPPSGGQSTKHTSHVSTKPFCIRNVTSLSLPPLDFFIPPSLRFMYPSLPVPQFLPPSQSLPPSPALPPSQSLPPYQSLPPNPSLPVPPLKIQFNQMNVLTVGGNDFSPG